MLLISWAKAIPAYPHKIPITINGKTVFIRLYGDEHSKRAEAENGYTIMQNDRNEWCYARLGNDSTLEASSWRLGYEQTKNKDFNAFINSISKHLIGKRRSPRELNNRRSHTIKKAIGQRRILIILMQYKDLALTKTQTDFNRLFNEEGYSEDNAQGSVKDYYRSASYNQLELESDIYGPYTAHQNMSYYGRNSGMNGNDTNPFELFEEAITNVAVETNLSQYDCDGDGFIDNVHIIFAGYGEEAGAASDAIWSHEMTFGRPYEIQGMKIDRYSCAPELRGNSGGGISRIGPHCHEIGHALGAMDFYDTDYAERGEYAGTGQWDIMASGSWNNNGITPADFNPYVKAYNYGWITPGPLPTGSVSLQPSCDTPNDYYILRFSESGDYYLLENRSKKNWGKGVPGEGLLIFHVHPGLEGAGNDINVTAPQMCYVVCASSTSRQPSGNASSYGDINSDGCPYPGHSGNHNFGQSSTPIAFYWLGNPCGIELNDIILEGNGNIILTNNSTGASFEPVEMENIFFEGFEEEMKINIIDSSEGQWKVEKNSDNSMSYIDKPNAYEGEMCLQLSAANSSNPVAGAFEFSCMPLSESGKLRVKLYITSMRQQLVRPNTIKLGYKIGNSADWQYTALSTSENNIWKEFVYDLPNDTRSTFRIEGSAYGGSILALDNILVEQEIPNDDTSISRIRPVTTLNEGYYSLDGRRHSSPQHGINLLRMPDGTCRKIYVLK